MCGSDISAIISYNCQGCPRPPGTLASFGIAGLTNPLPQFNLYPNISFQNFPLWGDGFPGYYPVAAPDSIEQYEDTFTKVIGRHTLALGANLDFWQTKGVTDPFQVNGVFYFNGQYSSLAGEIPGVSGVSDLADLDSVIPPLRTLRKMQLSPIWLADAGSPCLLRTISMSLPGLLFRQGYGGNTTGNRWTRITS